MDCKHCEKPMDRGYFMDGRYIHGEPPKRLLRSTVWGKKSGFAVVFRCPQCGELKFYVSEIG